MDITMTENLSDDNNKPLTIHINNQTFPDTSTNGGDANIQNIKMDVDDLNSSITSIGSASSEGATSLSNSSKKVKLTKEELSLLKDEREKMKAQREILKVERERVRLEKEKARVEKEKQKIEREAKLQEEREKKAQELQEKKVLLEKEKQEKLRAKEDEKEKKESEKIRNREIKEKEKQRRLDEKIALDQEKIMMEEKKLEKSRAVLFNFLKKSKENSENVDEKSVCESHIDTVIKSKMIPYFNDDFDQNKFTEQIDQEAPLEDLYLHKLLSGQIKPKLRNEQHKSDDCDVIIIDDLPELNNEKFCFLQFCENIRPAYFGNRVTNSSAIISGRKPFARDETLNYDADSDEEWDEGGPGESLSDSEPETEEKDDYEIDNDFFVPHGYLSEDENEINDSIPEDDNQGCTGPLYKEQTLMAERNRRFAHSLVPQVIGCVWEENKDNFGDKFKFLQRFQRIVLSK